MALSSIALNIAKRSTDGAPVSVTPELLFGRHCAVVGSSGSGKSWSLGRIIEEAGKHKAKILLLDASGEFESMADYSFHIHLGQATRELSNSVEATIPYFELSEADLVSIFEPETSVQWMRLRSAMKTLRLLQISPALSTSGVYMKAHKLKLDFENELRIHQTRLARAESIFNIHKLLTQLECECVEPTRSQAEANYWGGTSSSDLNEVAPLIHKIENIIAEPELRPIFYPPRGPSAFEALEKFMTDTSVSVLRISLEFLPSLHRVREIVAQSFARFILSMARNGALRQQPLVIAIDEAHQVLKKSDSNSSIELPFNPFASIAKEGRKYGLTLCLATQRPADIPDDILSQVGAFIVHRVIGATDRQAIERATGGLGNEQLKALSTLSPGDALFLAAGFSEPVQVKMLRPILQPQSYGPNYQTAWRKRTSDD